MTAAVEDGGFGGPEFDVDRDLPGALRAGLETVRLAAAERGVPEDTVAAVLEAAFNPFGEFTASQAEGYTEVAEASISVNGSAWTDACLTSPEHRSAEFLAVSKQCVGYAAKHFPTLHEHDRVAVVEDLLYLELAGAWIHSTAADAELPGWMIPGIVFERLQWRLLDAKRKLVDRQREVRGCTVQSWDKLVDDLGERAPVIRPMWDVPIDDAGIESVVWAAARAILADRAAMIIQGVRAGSARDKVTLTVAAAEWVLTRGSQDSLNQHGEHVSGSAQELRHKYAQDSLLVSFLGLRAAAPATWGTYPDTHVPLLGDLKTAATEAKTVNRPHADWFTKVSARKNDLHKKAEETGIPGILHCVKSLVETLIEEAARDTDI